MKKSAIILAALLGAASCKPVEILVDSFEPSLEVTNADGILKQGEALQYKISSNHKSVEVKSYRCEDIIDNEETQNSILGLKSLSGGTEASGHYGHFKVQASNISFSDTHVGTLTLVLFDEATGTERTLNATYRTRPSFDPVVKVGKVNAEDDDVTSVTGGSAITLRIYSTFETFSVTEYKCDYPAESLVLGKQYRVNAQGYHDITIPTPKVTADKQLSIKISLFCDEVGETKSFSKTITIKK